MVAPPHQIRKRREIFIVCSRSQMGSCLASWGPVVFAHSDEEGMKCDTSTSDKGEVTHVITITGLPTANG